MSVTKRMAFDDNAEIAQLYGNHDSNLVRIEQLAGVKLNARGNQIDIAGDSDTVAALSLGRCESPDAR